MNEERSAERLIMGTQGMIDLVNSRIGRWVDGKVEVVGVIVGSWIPSQDFEVLREDGTTTRMPWLSGVLLGRLRRPVNDAVAREFAKRRLWSSHGYATGVDYDEWEPTEAEYELELAKRPGAGGEP